MPFWHTLFLFSISLVLTSVTCASPSFVSCSCVVLVVFEYETAFLFFSFCTILNKMCIFTYKSKGKCMFQL